MQLRAFAVLLLSAALAWGAPLLGLAAAGQPLAPYLGFPPRTVQAVHAPFAWEAFVALSLPAIAFFALLAAALVRARRAPAPARARARLPWWGVLGAALAGAGWLAAWRDGLVPPEWRRQSFTVLWLGYILVMNALALRRSGRAPLVDRGAWFLSLFPLSAAAWWLFEHLNQFVRNWHYTGIAALSGWEYLVQGSLPFSTVLPAVASTQAWLSTFPRLDALALPALRGARSLAWLALAAGSLALGAIGLRPELLFPALWIAPLLVLAGLQQLALGETMFAPLRKSDWRCVLQPALAALTCGFFWEMWNYGSLARWSYSIPFVQRFHVFEMPLLGYAGYLPFGVTCALVMDLAARLVEPRRGARRL